MQGLKHGQILNEEEHRVINEIAGNHGFHEWHLTMWDSNGMDCRYELETSLNDEESLGIFREILIDMFQMLSGDYKSNV